jgi:hypothetical protein
MMRTLWILQGCFFLLLTTSIQLLLSGNNDDDDDGNPVTVIASATSGIDIGISGTFVLTTGAEIRGADATPIFL